jgi:hypothetical protein
VLGALWKFKEILGRPIAICNRVSTGEMKSVGKLFDYFVDVP